MSFPPGTKVVCIDATPIPILVHPGFTGLDFTFPNGFLEEGRVYCVTCTRPNNDGSCGLHLAGLPILVQGVVCNWHGSRFRKLVPASERREEESSVTHKS